MVILHAYGVIKPEARERWLELLAAVTPPSRAEEACQSYLLYEAISDASSTQTLDEAFAAAGIGQWS